MLKAVRFDENNHKKLLDFIQNYYDNKGKLNESEGIRHLMQLGLDFLNQPQTLIDFDSMKTELLKEILQTVNSQNTDLLDKIDKIQPIYIQTPQIEKTQEQQFEKIEEKKVEKNIEQKIEKIKPKKINVPGNSNALLNNLLNNANK